MVRGPALAIALARSDVLVIAPTMLPASCLALSVPERCCWINISSAAWISSSFWVCCGELAAGAIYVAVGLLPITLSVAFSADIGLPCSVARMSARYSFALIAACACSSAYWNCLLRSPAERPKSFPKLSSGMLNCLANSSRDWPVIDPIYPRFDNSEVASASRCNAWACAFA